MEAMKKKLLTAIVMLLMINTARAQQSVSPPGPPVGYNFTASMAIIVIVLISALLFMVFFSIYMRSCSGPSPNVVLPNIAAHLAGRSRRGIVNPGLDSATIETFPTFTYSAVKGLKIGKGALECAICITEFDDDETLRWLLKCDHVFHSDCIDTWLSSHVTCPVCRANLSVPDGGDSVPDTLPTVEMEGLQNSISVRVVDDDDQNADDHDQVVVQPVPIPVPPPDDPNCINHSRSLNQNRPPRSGSFKSYIFSRLPKSHSTGHSVVQPGENVERFTLILPADVRKEIMSQTALNRASSLTILPGETSSRRGYRTSGLDGTSNKGKTYHRLESLEPIKSKSDRWFLTMAPPFFAKESSTQSSSKPTINDNEGNSSVASSRGFIDSLKKSFGRLNSNHSELTSNDSTRAPV